MHHDTTLKRRRKETARRDMLAGWLGGAHAHSKQCRMDASTAPTQDPVEDAAGAGWECGWNVVCLSVEKVKRLE